MAEIYSKIAGDQVLIPAIRESFTRPFNFGAWNEILFGMYVSVTSLGSGNGTPSGLPEAVTWHTPSDYYYLGVRNSSSTAFPFSAGAQFIGYIPYNTSGGGMAEYGLGGNYYVGSNGDGCWAVALNNATNLSTHTAGFQHAASIKCGTTPTTGSGYNGFWGFRMTVQNAGLASQTVTIYNSNTQPIAGTNYSQTALQTYILGVAWGSGIVLPWNAGGVALPLPDAIFLYLPFYLNRIRISAMELIKIS